MASNYNASAEDLVPNRHRHARTPTHEELQMNIRTFSGEDAIMELCTAAMNSTIQTLVKEGQLTQEAADKFTATHIALLSSKENYWNKVRKFLGWSNDSDFVVIAEIK